MAKSKKKTPEKSKFVDADKLRDVEFYDHEDKKRVNNPPVGMARHEKGIDKLKTYAYDPHIDPSLQWAGKAEGTSFEVPTQSIHIHETINPFKIVKSVHVMANDVKAETQGNLFEEYDPLERLRKRTSKVEFYQHGVDWSNRMIAGDSLVIMNSLLEKEGMAGQVQMVYIDPPYGIKYGSNFQPFTNKRDVKEKDEDLSKEPEMIKAFRDTWQLGIHSYLSYLRDRLLLARELLADSGSVFVQISDENVHHVREICDEIFGKENFVSQIIYTKTSGFSTTTIANISDYILWYCKCRKVIRYRQIFEEKTFIGDNNYTKIRLADGSIRSLTKDEQLGLIQIPKGARIFRLGDLTSQGTSSVQQPFKFAGKIFFPAKGSHWKANYPDGMKNLADKGRIVALKDTLSYVRYFDDFPKMSISNVWTDTSTGGDYKIYVVQSSTKPIQRCLLMTTDPGDLVLDITCGSGTTAYVAEQWGRRWITCDTSRVALTLAKKRLMTATFDYYQLAHPEQGVGSGFVYKTVPHITLKSIANDLPP